MLHEDMPLGLIFLDVLPEIVIMFFFLFLAFYGHLIPQHIMKLCWKVLFSVFCANSFLVLFSDPLCIDFDLVFILQKMPFATIFLDIIGVFENPADNFTLVSFAGMITVFTYGKFLVMIFEIAHCIL